MTNRLAIITGGTKALGRAVGERLLAEGFDVVLTYAHDRVLAKRVERELSLEFPSSKVVTIQADVRRMDSIDPLEAFLIREVREIDVLVLNAGVTDRAKFEELDPVAWDEVFSANVHVPVFTIKRLLKHFAKSGSVVFTGSLMGIEPHSLSLAYGVSKATSHAMVRNLVKFLSPYDIRVNAVAPGFVETEWQQSKSLEVRESIVSKISLGRFATPYEISDAFLLLIENTYINGATIVIDGGYSFE